jgi:fructokinase
MKQPAILSCGEVLWDLFPEGPRLGGAPANFACHAALLGGDVSFFTAVGDDARGPEAVKLLGEFGIDTSLVQIVRGATTGAVDVRFDEANKPHYRIHPDSSWDQLAWTPALAARVAAVDAIYFGTLGQRSATSRATIRRALDAAKTHGIQRVLDINLRAPFYDAAVLRESIALASIVKLSDEELGEVAAACGVETSAIPERKLRELLAQNHLDLIVLTRGAAGALLVTPDRAIDQPGIPATVVDTVGAGDSFTAALTLGMLRGDALTDIARTACEVASRVCSHAGAMPQPGA